MTESDNPYRPISCTFHDRLEDWAIRRASVEIVWLEGDIQQTATDRIADVFAKDGADHLRLSSGPTIRLGHLVSVDGNRLADAC